MTATAFPRLSQFVRQLLRDHRAVSTIEFALVLPVFMALGMTGVEIAYMSTVNMQVSQTAISVADNASRLGQTDNSSVTPTVTEADIDSILSGALRQGASFDLGQRGRIILSSVEFDPATGQQYIHWQRCRGALNKSSTYGNDGANNGLGARRITGVGRAGHQVRAAEGAAVMVAEVYYSYDSMITGAFGLDANFRQEAVFAIRDDRNLTPGVTGSTGQSSCS